MSNEKTQMSQRYYYKLTCANHDGGSEYIVWSEKKYSKEEFDQIVSDVWSKLLRKYLEEDPLPIFHFNFIDCFFSEVINYLVEKTKLFQFPELQTEFKVWGGLQTHPMINYDCLNPQSYYYQDSYLIRDRLQKDYPDEIMEPLYELSEKLVELPLETLEEKEITKKLREERDKILAKLDLRKKKSPKRY